MSKINEMIKAMDNPPTEMGLGNIWRRWHYASDLAELDKLCADGYARHHWGGYTPYFVAVEGDGDYNGELGFTYIYVIDGRGAPDSVAFIAAPKSAVQDVLRMI